MRKLLRISIPTALLLTWGLALADANDGEFLGYTVGSQISISDPQWIKTDRAFSDKGGATSTKPIIISLDLLRKPEEENVIFDQDTSFYVSVKPANTSFDEVLLLFTPMSKTVIEIRGYIRTKGRNQYTDLGDAPPGQVKHWSTMSEIQRDKLYEEAMHIADDLLAVLRSKYPKWKPSFYKGTSATKINNKCQFLDSGVYSRYRCEIVGDHYGLSVQTRKEAGRTNIRIGSGFYTESRDYGEVEVIFFALKDELYYLEDKEKAQYVQWLRKQRLDKIDKEGL